MTHDLLPPEAWAVEGRRVAAALNDVAAAIVTGRDPAVAALVALSIAEAHAHERRVAVADLVGGIAPLTIAETPGLLECLRDGTPVSDIARPLRADGAIYALPSGQGPITERWVYESARWDRLVGGFREVDALLLLVTTPHAPGLDTLIGRVDGVIAVDLPPTEARRWPLLATVDRPEAELPPIVATPPRGQSSVASRRTSRRRVLGVLAAGAVVTVGLVAWMQHRAPTDANAAVTADAPPAAAEPPVLRIELGGIVNPADSARAARFAVELVAANTLASANSRLESFASAVAAPTVAPTAFGSAGRTWYRALVGAWSTRDEADAWLASERARGVLKSDAGRVVEVPVALQLESTRSAVEAEQVVATWRSRGIGAYALRLDDGEIRVLAGAFEGPAHAALFALELRELGVEPLMVYRTGRSF